MKKLLPSLGALAFFTSTAIAQTSGVTTSCSDNQFSISANFAAASCSYSEQLNINGVESFEQIEFSGPFSRQIPLQEGDQASVSGVFQCSTERASFSATLADRTVDGCSGESSGEPLPTPDPTPAPVDPIDEFDPIALQELEAELQDLLLLATDEVDTLIARSERFATRSPRFAARILSRGIERLQIITDGRVDRLVNRFASSVEPEALLNALSEFNDEFDSIIDVQ